MANNKEQGTYENTLNNSEAAFLKYKKQIAIAVIAIIVIVAGAIFTRITSLLHARQRLVLSLQRVRHSSMHSSMTRH